MSKSFYEWYNISNKSHYLQKYITQKFINLILEFVESEDPQKDHIDWLRENLLYNEKNVIKTEICLDYLNFDCYTSLKYCLIQDLINVTFEYTELNYTEDIKIYKNNIISLNDGIHCKCRLIDDGKTKFYEVDDLYIKNTYLKFIDEFYLCLDWIDFKQYIFKLKSNSKKKSYIYLEIIDDPSYKEPVDFFFCIMIFHIRDSISEILDIPDINKNSIVKKLKQLNFL
jgi:hypothetical protein